MSVQTGFFFDVMFFIVFDLCLILLVAYFTLLERKILSAAQRRNGPDYSGPFGIFQPISDALKLLFKEFLYVKNANTLLFILSPFLVIILSLLCWCFIPITSYGALFRSQYSLV